MECNDPISQSTSSHARVEPLIQRAQESILAMSAQWDEDAKDSGRSPLSAKLAAYGERLALRGGLRKLNGEKLEEKEWCIHANCSSFNHIKVAVLTYAMYACWKYQNGVRIANTST